MSTEPDEPVSAPTPSSLAGRPSAWGGLGVSGPGSLRVLLKWCIGVARIFDWGVL